jgi:vacuolar-type H+-ATPase subunit I/STV1
MAQESGDWTTDLLDRLDHYIDLVRSNTTDRLVKVARVVVFGLVAAILGIMAAVVALIAAIRFLDVILPRSVWLPYLILGAIFLLGGLFAWRKAKAPAPAQ